MTKSDIKKIIKQLKNKEITVSDVSEEYQNNLELINFERKAGLRTVGKRGYDVISNSFFIEEKLLNLKANDNVYEENIFSSFDNFDSYYNFLNGDIYDNACYAFCPLFNGAITSYKVDIKKLMSRTSFIEKNIDNYSLSLSEDEKKSYNEGKNVHKYCQQWVKKFNSCCSYEELVKIVNKYNKSRISSSIDISFFFFQYIFADIEDKQRFSIIMEYMSSGAYPQYKIINALCSIYNPDDVIQSFNRSTG